MDGWLNEYPSGDQNRLRGNFQSRNNVHHNSAYWELLFYRWLQASELSPQHNVETPDFTFSLNDVTIGVELTTLPEMPTISDRELACFDRLVSGFSSREYDLAYDFDYDKVTTFPGSFGNEDKRAVENWLTMIHESGAIELSRESQCVDPLRLKGLILHASPKPRNRERAATSFIHAPHILPEINTDSELRKSIKKKARKMRGFDGPTIIGINVLRDPHLDHIDVENALFGSEQVVITGGYPTHASQVRYVRDNSGKFGRTNARRNTHISAVLVVRGVTCFSQLPVTAFLYENPFASRQFPSFPNENREDIVIWGGFPYTRRSLQIST